jgi:hypothetical protein
MALTDNIVAYWTLDEASGSRADSVGGNTLTDNNTVTSTTGKINSAAQFTRANSESLSRLDNTDLSTGDIDFTLSFWVNFASQPGTEVIAMKGDDTGGTHEYSIFQTGSTIKFIVQNTAANVVVGSGLANATWYHIVAWHDSVNNQIGIALNAGTPVTAAYSGGITDGTAGFRLGGDNNGTRYLDGLMDEVGFWKRVLTSGERTSLYNGGAGLAYSSFGGTKAPPPFHRSQRFFRRMGGLLAPVAGIVAGAAGQLAKLKRAG